jgi:HK97 gp10 family phage protein
MSEVVVSINVRGIEQALANLRTLEFAARRRVVSAAVRAANAVVVKAAKLHAPRRTGAMADSIRGSLKLDRMTGTVVGSIKFKSSKAQKKKGRDAYYAHMVIGGTRPHEIPKFEKRYAVFGGRVFSRVQHPGIKPNPFMERVAESSFKPAVAAFEKRFATGMETEISKLRTS